jgi:hypothetical protein
MEKVYLTKYSNKKILLKANKSEKIVEICRGINGRVWSPKHKAWVFPEEEFDNLLKQLVDFNVLVKSSAEPIEAEQLANFITITYVSEVGFSINSPSRTNTYELSFNADVPTDTLLKWAELERLIIFCRNNKLYLNIQI